MSDLLKRVQHEASCLAVIGTITLPAELHHELVAEVKTLRDFRRQVAGYVADLHRHIKVSGDEGRFVPMGICTIIGHLSQLIKPQ